MRILGIEVEVRKSRKGKGPLIAGPKQPQNFYQAVIKYKDRPDCIVKYWQRDKPGVLPKHVDDIPLVDTLEVARSIEAFIGSNWGGGYWQVQILDPTNEPLCTYQFAIGGPVYNTATGKKKVPGDPGGSDGDGSKRRGTLAQEIENMGQLAAVIKTMQGDGSNSGMDDVLREILLTLINNNLTKEDNRFSEAMSIIEVSQNLTPKIATESLLTTAIASIPGALQGIAALKGGGNAALAAPGGQTAPFPVHGGNGGVDMNALRNTALSMPAAMIAGLPPDEQNAINQLRDESSAIGQQPTTLPRPGGSTVTGQVSAGQGGGAGISPGSTGPSSSPYHSAIDDMIMDIRRDLASGAPDSKVAGKMMALMTFATKFTADWPHPVLAGIMSATEETGHEEFAKLCNQFGLDEARTRSLGAEILTQSHTGATETLESLEDTPTEEFSGGEFSVPSSENSKLANSKLESVPRQAEQGNISDHPEPQSEPQFTYETEADLEAANKAEGGSNVDVPGSAGIPEPEQDTSGKQPGRVQNNADSEGTRQTT